MNRYDAKRVESDRRRRPNRRKGAAAVELAVCLPTLILLVIASIEACSMIFLDHSLSIASYEGLRVAVRRDAVVTDVEARCNALLTARDVAAANVAISAANLAAVPSGEQVWVEVSAPCDANSILPPWFYGGKTLTARLTMVKE